MIRVRLARAKVPVRAQPGHRVGPEHGEVGHGGQDQRGHAPGPGVPHRAGDRRSPLRRHHRVPGRKAGQEATAGMTVQANPRPGLCDHNPRHYRPPHRSKKLPDTSRGPPPRPIPAARRRPSTGSTPSATVPIHPAGQAAAPRQRFANWSASRMEECITATLLPSWIAVRSCGNATFALFESPCRRRPNVPVARADRAARFLRPAEAGGLSIAAKDPNYYPATHADRIYYPYLVLCPRPK